MADSTQKQLEQAEKEYTRGNFKGAVPVARSVVDAPEATTEEKSRAQKLLLGMSIDPVSTGVFGVTVFVLLFLVLKFLL